MADKYQAEVTRSIRSWGFYTHKPTDAYMAFGKYQGKLVKPQEPGKADMIVLRSHRACFVELKCGDKGFPLAHFEQNKREWVALMEKDFDASIWLFLIMGVDPPNRNREKFPYARRAWLLPIGDWFSIEAVIPQKTLPMIATKGYSISMQENKLDAVNLLSKFELPWGKAVWTLPQNHLFTQFFAESAA